MDSRYSALEEGTRTRGPSQTRRISGSMLLRRRGLTSCRRCVLFLVVAVGVIILPLTTLYTFEGIENGTGALAVETPITVDVVHPLDPLASNKADPKPTSSMGRVELPTLRPTASSSLQQQKPAWTELPKRNLTQYVNPLIGTEGLGHVYAGSTVPFGMAKAVPDSTTSWQNQAGFLHDGELISGIGQLHDEGTGGTASLGNFPIWMDQCQGPTWEMCPIFMADRMGNRLGEPTANVGSFGINFSTGFEIEMTSTRRTNLFRIRPNDDVLLPILSVGLTDLSKSTLDAYADVQDNYRVVGNGTFRPSFGEGQYSLYFCMDTRTKNAQIQDHALIQGEEVLPNEASVILENINEMKYPESKDGAVILGLTEMAAGEEVLVRMGLSFISNEQACSNAEQEIPTFDFEAVSQSANSQFEDLLNRIRVNTTDVPEDTLTLFYSSLYRTLISPQNYTSENPLWNTAEPTFDSFYCIWDTFRFSHPLYNILVPDAQSQMIKSLLDIFKFEGWLPECRMSFCKGITQSGSNADTLLTDAYIKGITGISGEEAFKAIRKDAEVEPLNWGVQGRGNIADYNRFGYVPMDADYSHSRQDISHRTVSRSIEYAHNDFSIAMFARKMRNREIYDEYINRASWWQNLWRRDAVEPATKIHGFFQPRYSNGSWASLPGVNCETCYIGKAGPDHEFYEESAWSYSWFVPHDYAKLIELVGGPKNFTERLDIFFNRGFANPGNEPGLLQAVLYHYAGQPAKSAARTRKLIGPIFNTDYNGLPGNDDAGSLGAYLVWMMSGLVPIAGQSVYLLLPPRFPEVQFTVTKSRIVTHNFHPDHTYIQNVTVDGQPWTKNWISHDFFLSGRSLEITVGPEPSEWGTGEDDVPPSLSTGGFAYDEI